MCVSGRGGWQCRVIEWGEEEMEKRKKKNHKVWVNLFEKRPWNTLKKTKEPLIGKWYSEGSGEEEEEA